MNVTNTKALNGDANISWAIGCVLRKSICLAPGRSLSPLGGLIFTGAHVQYFIFISVAICTNACVNGTCSKPDTCSCNAGFYGQICDRGEHFKSFYLRLKSSPHTNCRDSKIITVGLTSLSF